MRLYIVYDRVAQSFDSSVFPAQNDDVAARMMKNTLLRTKNYNAPDLDLFLLAIVDENTGCLDPESPEKPVFVWRADQSLLKKIEGDENG